MGSKTSKCDQIFIMQAHGKVYKKGEPHQTDTSGEIGNLLHPCHCEGGGSGSTDNLGQNLEQSLRKSPATCQM